MPVAEIAAAITSSQAALNILKAMIGLRDAEAMRAKSVELKGAILESLDKAIEAREAQSAQLDQVRALEAEIAKLKAWDGEKKKYELKQLYRGAMTYMLKPDARGSEPAHWLCPNCFADGKKGFFQPTRDKGFVAHSHTGSMNVTSPGAPPTGHAQSGASHARSSSLGIASHASHSLRLLTGTMCQWQSLSWARKKRGAVICAYPSRA